MTEAADFHHTTVFTASHQAVRALDYAFAMAAGL